jgi:Spy/CpxP family protein refolding chaperone
MRQRTTVLIELAAVGMYALAMHPHMAGAEPGRWHHHPPMMGGGPGPLIGLLLHSTDLTADQETQVHQILDADRPAVQQIFSQLHQAQKDLANLLLAPQVQTDAVTTQQALIAQLQQELAQHETSTVMAIRAILTPEQLAKANAAKDQWQARHDDSPGCDKNAN